MLTAFDKQVGLHSTVDEWKLKVPTAKTYAAFKTHFTRAIVTQNKIRGTLNDVGIIHHVQSELNKNKENMEVMAQVRLHQAQLIVELSQELSTLKMHQDNYINDHQPLQPWQANTGAEEATLKMLLDLLKSQGGNKKRTGARSTCTGSTNRQLLNNLPRGERTKRWFPNSTNYCSTCGYGLDLCHNSKTFFYKIKTRSTKIQQPLTT